MRSLLLLRGALLLFQTALFGLAGGSALHATDYFLTIGGGYSRTGNQASLEANVVFFQQVLAEKHQGPRQHTIFFADGDDPAADLQVLAEKPKPSESKTPATDLLAVLHRRGGSEGEQKVTYRNHKVPQIAGALDPKLVRGNLETLAKTARSGDRLIIFVTAHGSEGKKDEAFNTSIDCWNNRKIQAREFAGWLDKLPADLPVVMVMMRLLGMSLQSRNRPSPHQTGPSAQRRPVAIRSTLVALIRYFAKLGSMIRMAGSGYR